MSKKQIIKEDIINKKPSSTADLIDLISDNHDIYYQVATDEDGEDFLIVDGWKDVLKIQQMIDPTFDNKDDTSLIDEYNWGFVDEWAVCDNCQALIRTAPDSYSFVPDYWYSENEGLLCGDCVRNEFTEEYLQTLINNHNKANTILTEDDLDYHGFMRIGEDFESGFYDRYDNPEEILKNALVEHPQGEFIFSITSQGQFATNYELWVLEESLENYDEEDEEEVEEVLTKNKKDLEEDKNKDWGIWQGVEIKYYKHFMIPVIIGFIHINMTKEEAEAKVKELRAEAEAHRAEFNLTTSYLHFKVEKPTEEDKEKYYKNFPNKVETSKYESPKENLREEREDLSGLTTHRFSDSVNNLFGEFERLCDENNVKIISKDNGVEVSGRLEDIEKVANEIGYPVKQETKVEALKEEKNKDRYILVYNNKPLNYFHDNDLPTPKGDLKNIIKFSAKKYILQDTEQDAKDYLDSMKKRAKDNSDRYEKSFKGATDKLLKILDKVKIVKEQSILKEEKESISFTKEEVNKYVKDLTQKFFDEGGYYDIWAEDDKVKAQIEWGDWKHNHLEFKTIVQHYFDDLNIKIKIDSEILEEDELGVYTAIYTIFKK